MVFIFYVMWCGCMCCCLPVPSCYKIEHNLQWIKMIFNGTKRLSNILTQLFLCKFLFHA